MSTNSTFTAHLQNLSYERQDLNFRLRLDIGGANLRIEDKIIESNGNWFVDPESGLDIDFDITKSWDSANESTVAGQAVNHQYSKSFEFEQDFHNYEEKYLNTGIYYFSFLRPLSEFQIAKMFVSHKKYLPIFRSCNLGSKVSPDIWCGDCPKCLFVALILSPFLTVDELAEIFGKDMLNDVNMENYFIELIGKSEHKPFECVGSIDEVNLAVSLAIGNILENGGNMPYLFKKYMDMAAYQPELTAVKNKEYCGKYSEINLLPNDFSAILKKEMERLL